MEHEYVDLVEANAEMDRLASKVMGPRLEDEMYVLLSDDAFLRELGALRLALKIKPNPTLNPDDSLEYIVSTMRDIKPGMSGDEKEQAYTEILIQILLKHGISIVLIDLFHVFIATATIQCPLVPGLAKARVNTRNTSLHLEFGPGLPADLIDECTKVARKHWRKRYPIQKYSARDNQRKAFEVMLYRSSHTEDETAKKFNYSTDNVRKLRQRVKKQRQHRLKRYQHISIPAAYIKKLIRPDR